MYTILLPLIYCNVVHSQATFTIPNRVVSDIGLEVPHPGVAPPPYTEEKKYHKYYQWVCFTLFFQAALFYLPRFFWKIWEAGRIQMLVQGKILLFLIFGNIQPYI